MLWSRPAGPFAVEGASIAVRMRDSNSPTDSAPGGVSSPVARLHVRRSVPGFSDSGSRKKARARHAAEIGRVKKKEPNPQTGLTDTEIEFEEHPPRHQWTGATIVDFPALKKRMGEFSLGTGAGEIKQGEIIRGRQDLGNLLADDDGGTAGLVAGGTVEAVDEDAAAPDEVGHGDPFDEDP